MKKLMVTLGAVAMAMGVHAAAAVNWNSGEMLTASGEEVYKDDITMYIWEVGSSVLTKYETLGAKDLSDAIYKDYGSKLNTRTVQGNSGNNGKVSIPGEYDKTPGQDVYAIVLLTDNTAETTTYMGNIYTGQVPPVNNLTAPNLGLKIGGSGAATAWSTQSVPEPTSGLLLLLGMAGLALRRRRA